LKRVQHVGYKFKHCQIGLLAHVENQSVSYRGHIGVIIDKYYLTTEMKSFSIMHVYS